MTNLLNSSKLFIKRNGSTILTFVGAAGVVTTAVMTAKATPKVTALLEKAKEEKGEELTTWEKVVTATPAYIPAGIVGVSTIACIFGANILNKRQQASIASAYALLDSSYKDYKRKVEDMYGAEAESQIKAEISKDKYMGDEVECDNDGDTLFYDYFSERYFTSTMTAVLKAEYELNRHLVCRDWAYLNDFYEALKIPPVEYGEELGWTPGGNLDRYWQGWVDFVHTKATMDDGLECYIIDMRQEPYVGFTDYC